MAEHLDTVTSRASLIVTLKVPSAALKQFHDITTRAEPSRRSERAHQPTKRYSVDKLDVKRAQCEAKLRFKQAKPKARATRTVKPNGNGKRTSPQTANASQEQEQEHEARVKYANPPAPGIDLLLEAATIMRFAERRAVLAREKAEASERCSCEYCLS